MQRSSICIKEYSMVILIPWAIWKPIPIASSCNFCSTSPGFSTVNGLSTSDSGTGAAEHEKNKVGYKKFK